MLKKIKSWLLENRHTRQTIVKNAFWLGVGTIVSRVIKALVVIYAARVLGAGEYGTMSYALSLAAMFSIFADIGMTPILTREASKGQDSLERYLPTSSIIKLGLIGISVVLILFVAPLFSTIPGVNILMPLAALLIIFDGLRDFGFTITRAKEKMEIEGGINLITGVSIAVLGFFALWIRPSAFSLLSGYVAGSGVGFLVAFFLLKNYFRGFWKRFDKNLAKKIFSEATPLALMGLLGALTTNTDTLMIGWMKGAVDVGIYSAALRIVGLIYLMPSLLSSSVFPLIARLANKDDHRVRSILEKIVPFSLLVSMPIFVGGAVLSKPIILFLFGAQYLPAVTTFSTLLFTVVLLFPISMILSSLFAYNKQKIMLYSAVLGGVGNVILDLILIPKFGILGSAMATVISQALAYGLAWEKIKKVNNFHTLRYLKRGIVAVTVMGVASAALNTIHVQVILNIIISASVYFGVLLALKEKLVREAGSIFHLEKTALLPDV